jgi:hypothetical protein
MLIFLEKKSLYTNVFDPWRKSIVNKRKNEANPNYYFEALVKKKRATIARYVRVKLVGRSFIQ